MSLETVCSVCGLPVGLMSDYRGPRTFRGPRKMHPHGDPRLPKVGGRMQRCGGSSLPVEDGAIYEAPGGTAERRRRREAASR